MTAGFTISRKPAVIDRSNHQGDELKCARLAAERNGTVSGWECLPEKASAIGAFSGCKLSCCSRRPAMRILLLWLPLLYIQIRVSIKIRRK
jgi:hypothetical protein